nr:MAG TPA: hypothetical protein [Caudoviricetes sp.]
MSKSFTCGKVGHTFYPCFLGCFGYDISFGRSFYGV